MTCGLLDDRAGVPYHLPDRKGAVVADIPYYLALAAAIALVIYSIILHEIAHGYAAFRLGDPTAALQGRLTLNPLAHIDPFHTILMPLMTYFFAGFVFGGAKPVPINPYKFRKMRKAMLLTGMAGPAVNLAFVLVFAGLHRLLALIPSISPFILDIIFLTGLWNMLLMAFNLIPVPPLDGSHIVSYFLWRRMRAVYSDFGQYGMLVIFLLIATGVTRVILGKAIYVYVYMAGYPARVLF
jgi:Zn-dependent protease